MGRLLKNSRLSRGMFIYGIFSKIFSENMSQKRKKIVLVNEGKDEDMETLLKYS